MSAQNQPSRVKSDSPSDFSNSNLSRALLMELQSSVELVRQGLEERERSCIDTEPGGQEKETDKNMNPGTTEISEEIGGASRDQTLCRIPSGLPTLDLQSELFANIANLRRRDDVIIGGDSDDE